MPGLVAKNTGQLAVTRQLIVQGAGDEDLPARQGEGVDGLWVRQQVEVEWVGSGAGRGTLDDVLPDPLDAPLVGLVRVEAAKLGRHFGRSLKPHGNL